MASVSVRGEQGIARAAAKLQALVRIPTVSHPDGTDHEVFDALLTELRAQFPLLHERLELTPVHGHGLLFRWPGRSAGGRVVPLPPPGVVRVGEGWRPPPFGGELVDGAIWGRGTLDDKGP